MTILKRSYLIILIILVAISLVYFRSSNSELKSFSLNLITEIIGIFITVFLIDYVIQEKEKREKIKILKNAYREFRKSTLNILNLLMKIYKATSKEKPSNIKNSYKEIYETEDFYKSIKFLDFMKKAPILPQTSWAVYINHEVKMLQTSFDKTIDKYGFVLDSTIITEMELLTSGNFLQTLGFGELIINADNSTNFKRNGLTVLATKSNDQHLNDFLDKLFFLNEYFAKQACEDSKLHFDSGIWLDKIAPKIGSGRIDSLINEP